MITQTKEEGRKKQNGATLLSGDFEVHLVHVLAQVQLTHDIEVTGSGKKVNDIFQELFSGEYVLRYFLCCHVT